ncbi:putative RNA-directed DNA polymerase from transposon BS [Lucilia cuprina]|nr:putative RNA-directed DNA polymerase from transposon BS [Lucilia cuprina]
MNNLGPLIDSSHLENNLTSDFFNVCHLNAQSLVPRSNSIKYEEMKNLLENRLYDVIGVSETWYKDYISDDTISLSGYQIFRNDRLLSRGGGVCLYISDKFKARVLCDYMEETLIESLFVEVSLGGTDKIVVGVVYLPQGNFRHAEDYLGDVASRFPNLILMGDFNTNLFDTTKSQIVRDFCIRAGLSVIHNCLPTHFTDNLSCSTLIDYFMVSEPDLVFDDQIAFLNSVILGNFEQNVPLRRARRPHYDKWMDTNEIKIARSKRNLAFRALREDNCEYNRNIYRINRNRLKSLIRRYRRNASINFFSNCNQTQFWNRLRSEGAIAMNVEEFNCNSILPPIVDEGYWDVIFSSNMGFSFRTVDELEVYNVMNSIKTNAQSLGEKGLLSTFQSGYRENYNTTGLTLGVVEALRHNMDMKFESLAIFLDYSRAFDSISHSMLITKLLNSFKFDNTACKLIRYFLTGRRQFTEVEGRVSTILEIFRGIPQGSVLGPLLFMMYVNDIFSQVHFCTCYAYADDIQLVACDNGRGVDYLTVNVNRDLKRIMEWSDLNYLSLNPTKTRVILFSNNIQLNIKLYLGDNPIQFVSSFKTLDLKLYAIYVVPVYWPLRA